MSRFAALIAATIGLACTAQEQAGIPPAVDGPATILQTATDAGDRYRAGTADRILLRVDGQYAVTVRGGTELGPRKQALLARRTGTTAALELREEAAPDILIFGEKAGTKSRTLSRDPVKFAATQAALAAEPEVLDCNPVFLDPASGLPLVLGREVVVRLRENVKPEDYFGANRTDVRPLFMNGSEFVVTLTNGAAGFILREVNRHATDPRVEWAEPAMLSRLQRSYQPNDLLFPDQWHHDHFGQNATKTNADIRTPQAWDLERGGSTNIVIAIIDDGVDLTHPDLAPNIFVNTGDNDNDGVDDDGNGAIDDINGFNFFLSNNVTRPVVANDMHGTSCAGMAAARGNNGIGVAGSAYNCRILPVTISQSNTFVWNTGLAQCVRYAAGLDGAGNQIWRGADVLSMSFTGTSNSVSSSALSAAAANGRYGLGTVIFAATGNDASGYEYYGFPMKNNAAGAYFVQFEYFKDNTASQGLDTVWISDVQLPDTAQTRMTFSTTNLPAGWTTGGNAPFTVEDNPAFAFGRGRYQARSGALLDGQVAWLRSPPFVAVTTNNLLFHAWVDSQKGNFPVYPPGAFQGDFLFVRLYHFPSGSWSNMPYESGFPGNRWFQSGNIVDTNGSWPAAHSGVIGVGGVTDMGYRYNGSQYLGVNLQFVAPTAGGYEGVWSTDRTGTNGYNTTAGTNGDYTAFSGTSAATPLAAGIGALLLSANPNLTRTQVRQLMRDSCDKVGDVPYSNGTNLYYGYGRVNAYRALLSNGVPATVTASNDVVRNTRVYYAPGTQVARDGFVVSAGGDVTFRAGEHVRLQRGFRAETGSHHRIVIDPSL